MIELREVTRSYRTPAGFFRGVEGVSLSIEPGMVTAVTGKSGSGKSTLLNLISGIDRPTGGEVIVANTKLNALTESELTRWRGTSVGIVFQFFQLLPTLTVLENLLLPMEFTGGVPRSNRRDRALGLLERMGLGPLEGKLPSQLSGGEQQRAAVARAMANDPPVILADEPTGNLDTLSAEAVFAMFRDIAGEGKTVVIVTHDEELAARADRRIHIRDGQVESSTQKGGPR